MPCSSSEAGAGSSWENCCSALTAFLSPPPATSTRTEAVLNSVDRSGTRGTRVTGRGSGIGSNVLLPSFDPLSGVPSSSADSTVSVSLSSRENAAGRAQRGISHVFNNDAAFVSAVRVEQVTGTDVVGTNIWPPVSSAITELVHPVSTHSNNEGGQREPCYLSATTAACVGASSTTAVPSAVASPVNLAASIVPSSAAPAAAVATAASRTAVVTIASTQKPGSVSLAAAPAGGARLPAAEGSYEAERETVNSTPQRSWQTSVRNGNLWGLAGAGEAPLPRVSAAVSSRERTASCPPAEARIPEEEKLLAQHASHQLIRRQHMSTAALVRVPLLRRNGERTTSSGGCIAPAPATGDASIDFGGGGVASVLNDQRNYGTAAAQPSADTSEKNCVGEEGAVVGAARPSGGDIRKSTTGWRHSETAAAAGDCTTADAAASVRTIAPDETSAYTEEETGRTLAKQVLFYSPEGSPVKEGSNANAPVLLPSARVHPGKLTVSEQKDSSASVMHHSMSFALQPRSRQALQQRESEETASRPARPGLILEFAEREDVSGQPPGQMFCVVASTGKAQCADNGGAIPEQESILAGQPCSLPLSKGISRSSTVWTTSCPGEDVCRRAEDYLKDDSGRLPGASGTVEVQQVGRSLLTGRRYCASDKGFDYAGILERTVAAEMMEIVDPKDATHAPVAAAMPLGGEALVEVNAAASEVVTKKRQATTPLASAYTEDAVQLTQKDRTRLRGVCSYFEGEKCVGRQSLRQRPLHGGTEECYEWGGNLIVGDRTYASRRGRCQRPASWKRVRQMMEGCQTFYRGCDLICPAAAHAVGVTTQVERKYVEEEHKWNARQGRGKQGTPSAANGVEERKRAVRTYGGQAAEDILCSTAASRVRVLKQSYLQEKINSRGRKKPFGQSEAETPFIASGGRRPGTACASKSVAFLSIEGIGLGDYPSQPMITVEPYTVGLSQADKPLERVNRKGGMLECDDLNSVSAAVALQSEHQNNSSESLVPTEVRRRFAGYGGEPYVLNGGACENHGGTIEIGGGDHGRAAARGQWMNALPLGEDKKETRALTSGKFHLNIYSDASASCQRLSRSDVSAAGGSACQATNGDRDANGVLVIETEHSSKTGGVDSRRRSMGPGDSNRFDDDISGDESSVSAEEAGSRPFQHFLSSRMLPQQHQLRIQESRQTISTAAVCPLPTNLSACMQTLWPSQYNHPPEDVDEDEASRFFKRRRCSLLLWGGIRRDRGHVAVQQTPRDVPSCTHALIDTGGSTEDPGKDVVSKNTANLFYEEQVNRRQEVSRRLPVNAGQQECDQTPLKQQSSRDEGAVEGSREDERTVKEPHMSTPVPTMRVTPEPAASPAGASALLLPSRLMRKRKRGVGASVTRLLFLQPRGASASKEDATLVNSLGSALTYEETQQLRRREEEQRRQEVLRQQEEARRKEEAAAARLKEQQKVAAAAIAAVNTTSLSSGPFVFGSAKPTAPGTDGGPATSAAPPAPAAQETGHVAITLKNPPTANALVDSRIAVSGAKNATDGIKGNEPLLLPVIPDAQLIVQNIDQQQQTKEASLACRPKLRIIRSPPSAGDSVIPAVPVAASAHGDASALCGAGMAANSSVLATSSEGKTNVPLPLYQQGQLPGAFGNAARGIKPPQADGHVAITPQFQMSAGLLPAEFGGVSIASGVSGTATTVPTTFGNASVFNATTAGTSTAASNPFAFQRGGRGLRTRGSGRRR